MWFPEHLGTGQGEKREERAKVSEELEKDRVTGFLTGTLGWRQRPLNPYATVMHPEVRQVHPTALLEVE